KVDIKSITVKKFRPTPSKEKVVQRDNLLQRDVRALAKNEKCIGDITYIHTLQHGWCYLASVMYLYTKKIVGFSFDRMMTTEVVIKALQNAYHTQQPAKGLIFHSDLGSQYTSDAFQRVIDRYGITQSFSYKGSPYDNACIESFHAILKKEEVNHVQYIDEKSSRLVLFQYIEGLYSHIRIHISIGYKTPQQMEE